MSERRRRALGLLLLGLVLAGVFLVAGPHDVLHDQPGGDCVLCHLHANEPPEPVRVEVPLLSVAHLDEPAGDRPSEDRAWTACAPRAPPAPL